MNINHRNNYKNILTEEFFQFLTVTVNKFSLRIEQLLDKRELRQCNFNEGELPDFLIETREIRDNEWKISDIPECIHDRRVEITGPPDRKMIINALNSGAKVYMADFEDSLSPTWENVMEGQINLIDAVRGTITYEHPTKGTYRLNNNPAVLFVRPRGLHLMENHVEINGKPISASLFDFCLYSYYNSQYLYENNRGPFFYIPKIEHYLEARLWNDIFLHTERYLKIPDGTIKATVLIETLPAVFQMNEILYELKEHSAGLNCGRWDYIFSYIKTLRNHKNRVLPDRGRVTMKSHFMSCYSELLVRTCHTRGAHAMGGMAAQIPIKNDESKNFIALEKVSMDKMNEVLRGHDGTWVAHPGLIKIAQKIFDDMMPQKNQIDRIPQTKWATQEDLLEPPSVKNNITESGIRINIEVGIQYLAAWLSGAGCVPINNLMEDAATAEISRTQLWQWVKHEATMKDGRKVTKDLVKIFIDEYIDIVKNTLNDNIKIENYEKAATLFKKMTASKTLESFLTLPAYETLISKE